jgi:hypothetical protein
MSIKIELDPFVSERDQRQVILAQIEQMLREREESWQVRVEVPLSHSGWWLSLLGPDFKREKLLFGGEQQPSFIAQLLRSWLAEFDFRQLPYSR